MIRNLHIAKAMRPMAKRMMSLASYNDNAVSVMLQDKLVKFESVFLRDACSSPESVDPFSRQKLFSTADVVEGLTIKDPPQVTKNANGEDVLHITWSQNGTTHKSEYPESFLVKYSTKVNRRADKFFESEQIHWDTKTLSKNLEELNSNYADYMDVNSGEFNRVVDVLNRYGLAFIHNCPEPIHEDMTEDNIKDWPVAHLAERFGYIKKTFYGTLFDVKNKKEAENIAYTKVFLPLHMDLMYYESPPGLQFLHALKNSTLGGENIFCDSYLAAQHIRDTDPNAYYALTQVPISYHYDNNGEYYYYERPLIVEEEGYLEPKTSRPKIKEVNYAPPFQGPFETGISEILARGSNNEIGSGSNHVSASHYLLKDFLRGYKKFEEFVNNPTHNYQIKLPEGTTVIFDNRRVLHSRNEFSDDNGGDRWLMGAYCDGDSFRSKLRIAKRSLS